MKNEEYEKFINARAEEFKTMFEDAGVRFREVDKDEFKKQFIAGLRGE